MSRYGITIPLDGVPLHQQGDYFRELAARGYTDLWSSEADGADGFIPLALAAAWVPEVRLGPAILPVYTRGPAVLAQTLSSMAEAAPGRFVAGLGSSSDVIVERWNGIPFEEPYAHVRDTVRFLKKAFTGEKVVEEYPSFTVNGFRLRRVPDPVPPVLVAALRSGMLRLAGKEGDGAIINWLSADDVSTVVPFVHEGGPDKEVVARIFVCPSTDADAVRQAGRFVINSYLNVGVYKAFHEWLGRGDQMDKTWKLWAEGDRKGALAAIPDEVVDDLIVHGSPEQCKEHIGRYIANGVTCPVLMVMPFGVRPDQAAKALAPDPA